jgi:tRNA-specific 2-thiouridylase
VLSTDVENNIIFVGEGQDHPGLYHNKLFIREDEIHWIRPDLACRQGLRKSSVFRYATDSLYRKGLFSVYRRVWLFILICPSEYNPGQFAAWYTGDELTGSGVISSRS